MRRQAFRLQYFANRSDMAGGSTLGNLAMAQVSMKAVDIGLPQLAMHSPFETSGVLDIEYLKRAAECFFRTHIHEDADGRSGWKQSNCSFFENIIDNHKTHAIVTE